MAIATPNMEDAPTYSTSNVNSLAASMSPTMGGAATGVASNASAASAGTTTANAANMTAASMGNATQATGTTVQDRLTGILNKGGALMQQAVTTGNQQAASRGLLNSSMGVQAAQAAVLGQAVPIASTDAQLLTNVAQSNAAAQNQASQFNAGNQQQASQFNASNQQQAAQFNASAQNQTSQFNAGNQQQVSLANQQAQNQMSQFNAGNQQQTNMANQQASNQASQFNAGNQQQTALANQQAQNQTNQFNAQNQNAQAQFNASQQNEATLKAMDVNSREQLANIEADYKQLMQINASAGTMYEQVMKNVNDIQTNPDVADKTTAINNQLTVLRSGLTLIQNLNKVTGLINF